MNDRLFAAVAHTDGRGRLARLPFCSLLLSAVGISLGLGTMTGAAAPCRKKSDRCDRSSQCCSNRCRRGFCYPRRR